MTKDEESKVADIIKDMATHLESLQRENETLRRAQSYTYIGRDGKSVLARDLEDRAEAAEAEVKLIREAVGELLDQAEHVCLGAHTPLDIKEAARNLADPIAKVRTALASTGGEHHGN